MFQGYCKTMLKKHKDDRDSYVDSDRFRATRESQELYDLGCTIEEKYSPARGWNQSLRNHFDEHKL